MDEETLEAMFVAAGVNPTDLILRNTDLLDGIPEWFEFKVGFDGVVKPIAYRPELPDMSGYLGALGSLSEQAAVSNNLVMREFLFGKVSAPVASSILEALAVRFSNIGVTTGALSASGYIARRLAIPVAVTGAGILIDRLVIRKGLTTLFEEKDPEKLAMKSERFAKGKPLEYAQEAYRKAVQESPFTRGWERETNPDACTLCLWWARDGRVWPKDHYMPTHTGCQCRPKPVVQKGTSLSDEAIERSTRDREVIKQLADTGRIYQR